MKRTYKVESEKLIKAIDISIGVFKEFPPEGFNEKSLGLMIDSSITTKNQILNAEPKFQNLTSLKYSEQDLFTYFQESSGITVEEFWKRISDADLPYERINKLEKILKRNKIKDDHEYNYIIDTMVPQLQEGGITNEQFAILDSLLDKYSS
jgi:hypothetical protein